jgi:hypothetical protein
MSSDGFNQMLTWLQARTDRRFQVCAGMIVLADATIHGREPSTQHPDDPEFYELEVRLPAWYVESDVTYLPACGIEVNPDIQEVEVVGMQLRLRERREQHGTMITSPVILTIIDTGETVP